MDSHRCRRGARAFVVGCFFPLAAAFGADNAATIGVLSPTSLYMQSGTVDLSAGRGALGTFIAAERKKDGLAGRHFVLQLTGPMRPEWRTQLAEAGIDVGDYIPMNSFIVTMDRADATLAARLEFVRWFGEFRREWKLAPGVGNRPLLSPERLAIDAAGNAVVVISIFRGDAPDAAVARLAKLPGAQIHWVQPIAGAPSIAATIAKQDIPALADLPSVQFIEDAPEVTPRNDTDRWIVQSNIPDVTPLYDHGIHGEGQVLGLLDTRLDRNHCSFFDANPIGPLHRKILAYNASFGAEFHGTHVAGTAVGDHNDWTATRGVAYLGKLVYNSIPNYTEAEVESRLNLHHSQGARIHSNSWGDDGTVQYNTLCRGIDAFSYDNEDDLVLFAVTNLATLKNPENAKDLLAVGASQDAPMQSEFCSGGNGPTSDQRRKPEIYAPGCGTNSASAGTACSIVAATGTSMACPAVAGTAMLVREYFASGFYPSGAANAADSFTPSGALVKAALLNSAVDMTGIAGYPSSREGWGRVLADDALYFQGDARRLVVVDVRNDDGLATGQLLEHPFDVLSSGQLLKVTLAWTDAPATAGVAFAPVNDLDLEVDSPAGAIFLGNVFASGRSSSGGTRDDRNNVEQVHLEAPQTGRYVVRVRGAAVNQGAQGFALVVTGDVRTPAACPCDWDASGGLDSSDFFDFLVSFFAGNADFNADGETSSQDFFDFLSCFFAGCV
jgi:hypothetical protein